MRVAGTWFRHHDPQVPPDQPTARGWRWNPDGVPTLYLASTPEGCRRELLRLAERAGFRASELLPRMLTRFRVGLAEVAALRTPAEIRSAGLEIGDIESASFGRCQRAAAKIVRAGGEGILASSSTSEGETLAVYPGNLREGSSVRATRSVRMTDATKRWPRKPL